MHKSKPSDSSEHKVELKQHEKAVNVADMKHLLNALAPSERAEMRRKQSAGNYSTKGISDSRNADGSKSRDRLTKLSAHSSKGSKISKDDASEHKTIEEINVSQNIMK